MSVGGASDRSSAGASAADSSGTSVADSEGASVTVPAPPRLSQAPGMAGLEALERGTLEGRLPLGGAGLQLVAALGFEFWQAEGTRWLRLTPLALLACRPSGIERIPLTDPSDFPPAWLPGGASDRLPTEERQRWIALAVRQDSRALGAEASSLDLCQVTARCPASADAGSPAAGAAGPAGSGWSTEREGPAWRVSVDGDGLRITPIATDEALRGPGQSVV